MLTLQCSAVRVDWRRLWLRSAAEVSKWRHLIQYRRYAASCTAFCSLLGWLVSYMTLGRFPKLGKNASCNAYAAAAGEHGAVSIFPTAHAFATPALGTAGAADSTLGSPPAAPSTRRHGPPPEPGVPRRLG